MAAQTEFAAPPLNPDGSSNPKGLGEVVVTFTQAVDPTSFSVAANVSVYRDPPDPSTGLALLNSTTAVSTTTFSNGNTRLHLVLAPSAITSEAQYAFAIDTTGLRFPGPPPIQAGIQVPTEVRAARVIVVRPSGVPLSVLFVDPPNGSSGISPHATIRLTLSEIVGPVHVDVSVDGVAQPAGGGLMLLQDVEPVLGRRRPRTVLVSPSGHTLRVNAQYTVRLKGNLTTDDSGQSLASDFSWTFRTGGVRVDSPRQGAEILGTSVPVGGVVASGVTGDILVSVLDATGSLLAGPVVATRLGQNVLDGAALVNPWNVVLSLAAPPPAGAQVTVQIGTIRDALTIEDSQLDPLAASPRLVPCDPAGAGTWCAPTPAPTVPSSENPFVVTRDNPEYRGTIRLHPDESVQLGDVVYIRPNNGFFPTDRFFTAGMFLLQGTGGGNTYGVGSPSLLPVTRQGDWKVQGTRLSMGRLYAAWPAVVRVNPPTHPDLPDILRAKSPLWLRLSDQVLVVPVIVIGWYGPGIIEDKTSAKNLATRYRELLDFNADADQTSTETKPGSHENPPDEIFDQCGIQFQVIETLTAQAAAEPTCGPGKVTVFNGIDDHRTLVENQFQRDPEKGEALTALKPFILNVASLNIQCSEPGGLRWIGKDSGGDEITIDAKSVTSGARDTTAHEFGHQLGYGDRHCEDPPTVDSCIGDLMAQGPHSVNTRITFCQQARGVAMKMSQRFQQYLDKFGPPREQRRCCDATHTFTSLHECGWSHTLMSSECEGHPTPVATIPDGGFIFPTNECCAAPDGGLHWVATGSCQPGPPVFLDLCSGIPQ